MFSRGVTTGMKICLCNRTVAPDLGWGLLSLFPPFRYFPKFSTSPKYMLAIEYHVHIWQVLPQLSCGDACQICMWFEECSRYLCMIEKFAYVEINERSFSNPHPLCRTWWMYVSLYSLWLPHLARWRGPVCDMYRGGGGRPLGSKVSISKVVMNGEARLYESTPLGSSSHEQANLCSSKGGFHLFHRVSVAQAWADSIWSIRIHGSVIVCKSVQIVSIVSKQTGCWSAPHSMAVMELMDSSRTEWLQETWKYICISYHLSIVRWHIYLWLFPVQGKDSFMRHRQETREVSNGHHCPLTIY